MSVAIRRPEPDRGQIVGGLPAEYRLFADLICGLDTASWSRPTRCAGWHVRDVAGHVAGQAVDTVTGAIGSRTPDQQAAALRGESPRTLAATLRGAAGSLAQMSARIDDAVWSGPSSISDFTVGQGMHALLGDAYLHADDIRAALGLSYDTGTGLYLSLDFVLGALVRRGVGSVEPGIGRLLPVPATNFTAATRIDAHDFLLAATGRLNPARLALPAAINLFG